MKFENIAKPNINLDDKRVAIKLCKADAWIFQFFFFFTFRLLKTGI